MVSLEQVRALVAEQPSLVADPARRAALRALLLAEPRAEARDWDYGASGEPYPYWVVAEAPERGVVLAFCDQGFGPEMPWGFLFTGGPAITTLGMDAQWGWYLEEAFVRSGLWQGEVRPDEAYDLPPEERGWARLSRPDA